MKPPQGVWGIDLGQCALKAVRLQDVNGQLTATAFDYVEHPKILSQPDADPDQLTREALEQFLSRNTLRGDIVCISVPGQSGLARFVKLPPVEEKKITDIVKFEAKQQIPFNLDEVVWDFQKIGSGTVTDGFAMDTEIGLFAMKRDMVNKYLQHFKDVNVEIHVIQMAPLALCNYAAYDLLRKENAPGAEGEEESGCVCCLDLGTDSSNLVITDGDRIIWQRPIPIGGNHFTRALSKDLKLTFAKAEHLKRNATKSPDLKKILSALKPVLNDFVSEVQRSLGYFTNTHRDAQISYMVGLGNAFRLPGLQRFLEEKLQLSVRKLQKVERLTGDTVLTAQVWTENILSFGVAYGLALQGLKRTRLLTNLLPHEIRLERLIRAKKPWAVASAAALLIGLAGLVAGAGLSFRAYGHPEVKAARKKAEDAAKRAETNRTQFVAAKGAAEKEKRDLETIVSGQEEYRNWLTLMRYIGDAIPKPDGSNLPSPEIKKFYMEQVHPLTDTSQPRNNPISGRAAYEAYLKGLPGSRSAPTGQPAGVPGVPLPGVGARIDPVEDLGEGIDDRVQLNIESIDSRYFDELKTFWDQIKPKEGDIFPVFQQKVTPTGRGWVIEIRGYTFHHKERKFLLDTFVPNLVRLAEIKQSAPGSAAPARSFREQNASAQTGTQGRSQTDCPAGRGAGQGPAREGGRPLQQGWEGGRLSRGPLQVQVRSKQRRQELRADQPQHL